MVATTIKLPRDYDGNNKLWAARVTGRDPKFGFKREFLPSPIATEPGLYATSADQGRHNRGPNQRYYLVLHDDTHGLVRTGALSEESVALIVDQYLDRIDKIVPQGQVEGKDFFRWARDGRVQLRGAETSADALIAERERLLARLAEIDAQLTPRS